MSEKRSTREVARSGAGKVEAGAMWSAGLRAESEARRAEGEKVGEMMVLVGRRGREGGREGVEEAEAEVVVERRRRRRRSEILDDNIAPGGPYACGGVENL